MKSTAKKTARMLASLLNLHGVHEAVVSPGSRNAPLVVALDSHPDINTRVVIDERSAAFIALGMSIASGGEPVAIVCTSGTAPLNYAPAVAEAYYRGYPLIVVTADRPVEWIDQDDSQTIRQPGIYANFIKGTYDIDAESNDNSRLWMQNRLINDALNMAMDGRPGPVHINMRLDEPLGNIVDIDGADEFGDETRLFTRLTPVLPVMPALPQQMEELAAALMPPTRVLVLAGFMRPSSLEPLLEELARRPNFVVMHEAQSNLANHHFLIPNIDTTLRMASGDELHEYAPDIVITIGGAITSRMVKTWLRGIAGLRHWSIGPTGHAVDCFRKLSLQLPYDAWGVLAALVPLISKRKNSESTAYKNFWQRKGAEGLRQAAEYAAEAPWSDFKAMSHIIGEFPKGWHLQLSNGTAVRYAQLFDYSHAATIECNRGVSGIDGCTSTAIGAAVVNEAPTMLVTGDMSMQYDLGALACDFIPKRFKIVVLNNGGGGIFCFIRSTRSLEALEKYFVGPVNLPLGKLAAAFGFKYFSADNEESLIKAYKRFISTGSAPAILEIITDGRVSAEILTRFFKKSNV